MSKILFLNDLHIGSHKDNKQLKKELKEIVFKTIKKSKPKLVVMGGDLFHKKLSKNSDESFLSDWFITMLVKICIKRKIYLRIIKGTISHDYNQLNSYENLQDSDGIFRLIRSVEVEILFKRKILFIPEEYPIDWKEYYSEYLDNKYDFIFGHGTFDFASWKQQQILSETPIQSAPVFDSEVFSPLAKLIVFGHIHIFMKKKNIIHSASFSRNSYGEEKDKGMILITYFEKTKKVKYKRIINHLAPTFKTVNLKNKEFTSPEKIIDYINKKKEIYDNVRIIGINNLEFGKEITRKVYKNDKNVKIDIKAEINKEKRDESFDFVLNKEGSNEEIVKKFIKIKKGKDISIEKIIELTSDIEE